MDQPYIFKKQIIFLAICLFFVKFIDNRFYEIRNICIYFSVLIFGITFVPSLKKMKNYNDYIHMVIYYGFYIVPIFKHQINFSSSFDINIIVVSIIACLLILLTNFNHFKFYLSKNNKINNFPISLGSFIFFACDSLIGIIAEEYFFRSYLITSLKTAIGKNSILISSFSFVLIHYLNRWSNTMYNIKSYINHLILGLVLGMIFYYSNSLLAVIVGHFVFNSPEWIINIKRLFMKRDCINFFD